MMEMLLKVTPEKLTETAQEFMNTETNIRNLTREMMSVVDSFKPIWQGEAATGFSNKFAALSDDMERLYAMIRKHAEDLMEIAGEYSRAEEESRDLSATLGTEAAG